MLDSDSPSRPSRNLFCLAICLFVATFSLSCTNKALFKAEAKTGEKEPVKQAPKSLPAWLGNAERNFYGTGPWGDGPLEIVWENETDYITGRLHEDLWGGTSWPGQAFGRC